MFLVIVKVLIILLVPVALCYLYQHYLDYKKNIVSKYSSNFFKVRGKIIFSEVGLKYLSTNSGHELVRYFPYIKYQYQVDGINHISDSFSSHKVYYPSNIKVIQIINNHQNNLSVYVSKKDHSLSYLEIYDDKYDAELISASETYYIYSALLVGICLPILLT